MTGLDFKQICDSILNKLKNKFKDNISKEEAKRESSKVGGDLGNMLLFFLKGFLGWAAIQSAREYSILEFLAYVIALFLVWGFQGKSYDDEDKWW